MNTAFAASSAEAEKLAQALGMHLSPGLRPVMGGGGHGPVSAQASLSSPIEYAEGIVAELGEFEAPLHRWVSGKPPSTAVIFD